MFRVSQYPSSGVLKTVTATSGTGHNTGTATSLQRGMIRPLRRADHSSRGVLPTVVRRCVWSRNFMNEEAMARVGPQRHKKKQSDVS